MKSKKAAAAESEGDGGAGGDGEGRRVTRSRSAAAAAAAAGSEKPAESKKKDWFTLCGSINIYVRRNLGFESHKPLCHMRNLANKWREGFYWTAKSQIEF